MAPLGGEGAAHADLVIRGERDFWSRPEDLEALRDELTNAPSAHLVTIPDGTHYLLNDRPQRGRQRFLAEVIEFLAAHLKAAAGGGDTVSRDGPASTLDNHVAH